MRTRWSIISGPSGHLHVSVDDFLPSWHDLVQRWVHAKHVAGMSHSILRDALDRGLAADPLDSDAAGDPADIGPDDALECEIAVLRLSGLVDEAGYVDHHLRQARKPDPVAHFCERGWKDMLNPSLDFDVWWYWFSHLGLDEDRLNPLLHYALAGRHAGLPTREPQSPPEPTRARLPRDRPVRRACLFAAFDVDGIVDDYVVFYLRELSRHCDVFYLADSFLDDAELAKLADITVSAWAIPHGRYDFGSYAMLAQDLVGWDRLDGYDEVVIANDSCYALTGFDHVFARMDERACDWWGLQAAKADYAANRGKTEVIPLASAKAELLGHPEWRQMDHLHISSYFVVLRRPAFQDPGFRRLIAQVGAQPRKVSIILKYEIGLSRQLISAGHDFDTYIDKFYPFHPVYNDDTFKLIADGFPLLKRNFLTENSTKTADLAEWKSRVLTLVPDARVDMIEHNLERVAPHDMLAMSFAVVTDADGRVEVPRLMNARRMRREDSITPKFEHWWAFPVSLAAHQLSSDARAIFEEVRDDPSIKKVILTRSRPVELTGTNTVVAPLRSPQGQHHLLRAGRVLVSDPPAEAGSYPLSTAGHTFIDLSAGPALSYGPSVAASHQDGRLPADAARVMVQLAGSGLGSLLGRSSLPTAEGVRTFRTGAPRADLVVRAEEFLPPDLVAQINALRTQLDGRRLVLFMPTYAGGSLDVVDGMDEDDVGLLRDWLQRTGTVLGLRENPADRGRSYARLLAPLGPLDLSVRRFPHAEILYRLSDTLVSDYAPGLVDFLLTGRPVVVHAPDYDQLRSEGRVPLDLHDFLPGPVCRDFRELTDALDAALAGPDTVEALRYAWSRDLFFEHQDDHNAWRAVQRLRAMAVGYGPES